MQPLGDRREGLRPATARRRRFAAPTAATYAPRLAADGDHFPSPGRRAASKAVARACLFCYDRLFDQVDARRQAYARRLDQLAADGLLEDEAESSGMTRDRQRNVIRTARLVRGQRAEA